MTSRSALLRENSLKTKELEEEVKSENSIFKQLANKYSVTESQVLLQWALQQNYAVLPKTIKIPRLKENFDFSFSIQDSDMDKIKLANKVKSYILNRYMELVVDSICFSTYI